MDAFKPLPVASRYLTRNAERAMGGYIVRGLVELITNARDSGYRMLQRGNLTEAEVSAHPIELEFHPDGEAPRFVVRDRFEGMSVENVRERLLRYGDLGSEFEQITAVRGINARGAKDVGVLGEVVFRTIRDGRLTTCRIIEGKYSEPDERKAVPTDRGKLELGSGNGTHVTLLPFPDTTIPRFSSLVRDLQHHIELRYTPDRSPRVPIVIREVKQRGAGRERILQPFSPDGELVRDLEFSLPEWSDFGDDVRLHVYRSDEPLDVAGRSVSRLWRGEAGIMVVDGRTAHDLTFFGARSADDVGARFVFGRVMAPHIPQLLIGFEEFQRQRDADPSAKRNPLNPSQVTDPDRLGLNREHPYIKALEERVKPVLEEVLREIQKDVAPSVQDRVGKQLQNALERLGEHLAEKLQLGPGGSRKGRNLPLGLSAIPPGARLEIDSRRKIGVYYKSEDYLPSDGLDCQVRCDTEAVRLTATDIRLERTEDDPYVHFGYAELIGVALTDMALVEVASGDSACFIRASVREPSDTTIRLDKDLQFSRRSYTSTPGRKKYVDVWADPSLEGSTVSVEAVESRSVEVSPNQFELEYDPESGIAVGKFVASSATEATGELVVRNGDLSDRAALTFRDFATKPRIEFKFVDRDNFGVGRRFKWDQHAENLLLIAAKHSTLRRVLGPDEDPQTGEKWPGQEHPQTKAILAEIIAEAYVSRKLQEEAPNLGMGVENLVDPVDYENYRYECFEQCFAVCHEMLTPPYDAQQEA